MSVAPTWPAFLGAVFLLGLGFGALVIAQNQLVAYSEGRRRAALLSALNSAYSAGAVGGPIVVAAYAAGHFTLLFLGGAAVALVLIPGHARISGRLPVATGSPGRPGLLVLIFVCAFALYVGIETGTGGWMTSHLESVGLASAQAATLTSGFFLALVTGRVLMTLMPAAIPDGAIVIAGSAVATLSLLARFVHPGFLWIDAFVGANLLQSAFTGFCPLEMLVRRAGLIDRPGAMWTR